MDDDDDDNDNGDNGDDEDGHIDDDKNNDGYIDDSASNDDDDGSDDLGDDEDLGGRSTFFVIFKCLKVISRQNRNLEPGKNIFCLRTVSTGLQVARAS